MKKLSVTAFCILFLFPVSRLRAQSESWEIDAAHSAAHFSVRHMMVSNVRGEFGKMSGKVVINGRDLATAAVEATIDATTISTRNENRDNHLKSADFFDVAKYPVIVFKSKRAESAGEGTFRLVGDLTMHGITREVTLHVEGPTPEIKDQRGTIRVGATATTRINRKDFDILWNRTLDGGGLVVGDEVSITIDVELVKKS